MEANSQHIGAEPGPGGDNVAEYRHDRKSAALYQVAIAGVQDDCIPEHNQQRTVFLWVPAPEKLGTLFRKCPELKN